MDTSKERRQGAKAREKMLTHSAEGRLKLAHQLTPDPVPAPVSERAGAGAEDRQPRALSGMQTGAALEN